MNKMPKGGRRKGAGRKQEFDGVYQLRYKDDERKAWERAAENREILLAVWIRDTLNQAAKH